MIRWPDFHLLALVALLLPLTATAHGGGLEANGCRRDRRNGGYHCHRSSNQPDQVRSAARAISAPDPGASNRVSGARAFVDCAEARAAGAAPVRKGQAGYGTHLDRDHDGIGCE